jgi:pSer/pThr/pTyr-binding forkhead associated (FHA) protein
MELKLIVLAGGAKEGLEIPLKKDKFLIGRAKECSVRASSEAISRRHCAIIRVKDRWAIRDLGSRNGTFVNDNRITEPVRLKPGDELRVGPLKFRVASVGVPEKPAQDSVPPSPDPTRPRKQPPVRDVADVVERTIKKLKSEDANSEDDISRWLLGMPDPNGEAALKETRTIHMEDTAAHKRANVTVAETSATIDALSADADLALESADADRSETDEPSDSDSAEEATKSGGWSLFKRGKGAAAKQKPGKLPPRPEQASKDSREAAADILREMQRRR